MVFANRFNYRTYLRNFQGPLAYTFNKKYKYQLLSVIQSKYHSIGTDRHKDIETYRNKGQTVGNIVRQIGRQNDRHKKGHEDKRTDRGMGRQRHRHT